MSRQTSDRLVPISSAIFVPLATTVAWLMSRRTMRPRRTSVALCTDGRLRVFVETEMEGIITSRWSLVVSQWQPNRGWPQITNDQRLTTSDWVLSRRNSQTHIHCRGRLRQRPYRDEIHTRFGVRPHIFEINSARALQRNPPRLAGTDLDRLAHRLNAHIVKQNRLRPALQRLPQLFERPNLNLDRLPAPPVADRTLQRRNDAPRQRNVIALDQHAIGKIQPVILPASASNRVFVNQAQSRRRLAGIKNPHAGALHRIHKLARSGGDSGHPLQKIQDHPLTRQNHPHIVLDHSDLLPRVYADPIKNRRMARHLVMRSDRPVQRR